MAQWRTARHRHGVGSKRQRMEFGPPWSLGQSPRLVGQRPVRLSHQSISSRSHSQRQCRELKYILSLSTISSSTLLCAVQTRPYDDCVAIFDIVPDGVSGFVEIDIVVVVQQWQNSLLLDGPPLSTEDLKALTNSRSDAGTHTLPS